MLLQLCEGVMCMPVAQSVSPGSWVIPDCQAIRCRFGEGFASLPTEYSDPDWGKRWFGGGDEQDKEIKDKFGADVEDIRGGKLAHWCHSEDPYDCLAGTCPYSISTHNTSMLYVTHQFFALVLVW